MTVRLRILRGRGLASSLAVILARARLGHDSTAPRCGVLIAHGIVSPEGSEARSPSLKGGLVVSWCGMRGIVTLATAFALPEDFPYRDLILFTPLPWCWARWSSRA